MSTDKFLRQTARAIRRVRQMPRRIVTLSTFWALALLLAGTFGCAPSPSTVPNDLPEITDETIRERINDARVRQVPEENGTAEPISWSFYEEEPKEIRVVEKQIEGARATIILDIKTGSAPNAREPRQLAGQIRTEWRLETGWALRRWEIIRTENISMKYRKLPKPPAPNSNH